MLPCTFCVMAHSRDVRRAVFPADDLLAAFTLPHNPANPPVVTSWQQTAAQQAPATSQGKTNSPKAAEMEDCQTAARDVHRSIHVGARLWQENVRLAQEGLTLLRVVLSNNSLGKSQRL